MCVCESRIECQIPGAGAVVLGPRRRSSVKAALTCCSQMENSVLQACWQAPSLPNYPTGPSFYFHFSYFLISLNHCLLRNILLISRGFSFNSIVAISHVLYVWNLFRLLELVLCAVECPALWLRGVFIVVLSDAFYRWPFRLSCLITFPLFICMCYTIALWWILKITYLMTNIYKYQ